MREVLVNMLLGNLLEMSVLSKAQVIAGLEGLTTRDVLSVNIMDAPDIVTFLKQGDLLLTNGYLLKDRPEALVDFVQSMHGKGCAGLAIKTQRFSLSIPQEVLDEADRLHFPILELSMIDATLGEIFQQSIGMILDNKNDELHYALTIHKQFADMIMKGDGLARIVDTLSSMLSTPVLLLNVKLQPLAQSSQFSRPELRRLPVLAAASLAGEIPPQAPLSLCFPHIAPPEFRHVELFPIHTYRHEGYLLSFYNLHVLSGTALLAFEQAAHVIGLEMTKKHAVKERSRRYKNDFFSDVIEGFVRTEQEVLHRGAKYGLKANGTSFLIVAKEDEKLEHADLQSERLSEEILSAERDRHYEIIKQEFAMLDVPFVMFSKNDLFGILVFHDPLGWDEAMFRRQLESATERMYRSEQVSVSFGIGKLFTNALDLRSSYKEALKAIHIGQQTNRQRFVQFYRTMDFGRLLSMVPHGELEIFYQEAFKGLLARSENEQRELFRTLKAYYEHHCNIIDTSKALFVHRNTVIYRLEKCEKLMGCKLKDPQVGFGFQIAFAIESLLKNENFSLND
ncbi:PucR family transcriptional regulator [Paenibacillaceae bacterium]|nr:PucR family transcriptional regulator [Paenibacillaceae bacterium]